MKISILVATNGGASSPDKIGERAVETIRAAMEREGINASGKTSRSLGCEETDMRLTIYAEGPHAPIFTLQHGSGPHRNSEPQGFEEAIREWVRVKPGFVAHRRDGESEEKALDRAASAIIHSIRNFGTNRFKRPRADIYSPALAQAVEEFRKKVGKIILEKIIK